MRIVRIIWAVFGFASNTFVLVKMGIFAVCMIGYFFDLLAWPHISGLWMFTAVIGAVAAALQVMTERLKEVAP